MFPINDKDNLYLAYLLLRYNLEREPRREEHIKEIKAEVRRFQNKPLKDRQCIYEDNAPSYILKIEAPAWCKTKEDVMEWFERDEYLVCQPSQYDCTGQHFTHWYKPALLHGKWYAYHSIGVDV